VDEDISWKENTVVVVINFPSSSPIDFFKGKYLQRADPKKEIFLNKKKLPLMSYSF
jgi:hypothetical protein